MDPASDTELSDHYDVVVVGAGFAGLYLLHRLRSAGHSAIVLEAGDDIGGTWFWNRYPGARCDVDSIDYQLGFPEFLQREWSWTERYAGQPEIERYLRFVADRLELRRDCRFRQKVVAASYDADRCQWTVTTEVGSSVRAQFCVMATGCLSVSQLPVIPGREQFAGDVYHTAAWPHNPVDFSGKRVAVIGTGSSGVQVIPAIAKQAETLYVLQRTPSFVFPAGNQPLSAELVSAVKQEFATRREAARRNPGGSSIVQFSAASFHQMSAPNRDAELERRWQKGGFAMLGVYADLMTDVVANNYAADFVRRKIREVIEDPELAATLTPTGFPLGTKRPCLGAQYYETFLRPNVKLIDIREQPIARITRSSIVCGGTELEVDAIVFATGFDAMTGALSRIRISAGEMELAKKWADGPRAYLGLAVAGFPNLFTVTGPGSPSVISNVVVSIEQHVDWIVDCLTYLRANAIGAIEATESEESKWVQHVAEIANQTLYPQANSWYMGANIPGKPRMFLPYVGGVGAYRDKCDSVAQDCYSGFLLDRKKLSASRVAINA